MFLRLFALLVLLAAPAFAQAPPPPEPGASEPPPVVTQANSDAREALEGELAGLAGLPRAARLLRFVTRFPTDASTPGRLAEARRLVESSLSSSDRGLVVESLTAVFAEPEEHARGANVRALAALGEPDIVSALGYVARRDDALSVRVIAAESLGDLPGAAAEAVATTIARDPKERVEVRAAAARALGPQPSTTAGDALAKLALDLDQPAQLRQAAVDALRSGHPELAATLDLGERVVDASGTALGTLVGAASGAYTLGLVGALSQSQSTGALVGTFGGLVLGGTGAYLLARSEGLGQGDSGFMLSMAMWSVPVGWFAGTALDGPSGDCGSRTCTAAALGVHVAAMAGGWLLKDRLKMTVVDDVETNIGALAALFLTLGTLYALPATNDQRPGWWTAALGPTIGFGATAWFARALHLTVPLGVLAVIAAGEGAFVGAMLGQTVVASSLPSPRQEEITAGLALAGVGVGLGAMLAASSNWQPTGSDVQLLSFAALEGNLIGAALPMLLVGGDFDSASDSLDGARIGAIVGGLGGALAVGLLTDHLELRMEKGDTFLVTAGTLFAAWQGLGWSAYLNDRELVTNDHRSLGLVLGIAGFGSAALLAASQTLDLSAWQATWLFSGAAWGAWLGYWGAYVLTPDNRGDLRNAAALTAADAGLLVSALLLSPLLDVDPNTLVWVSVFGVGGMTVASMTAVFLAWNSTGKPVATANVIGSVAGLAIGAVVAPKVNAALAHAAAGRDLPGLRLPAFAAMPVMDTSGTRVAGLGAQLLWTL